MSRSLTVRDVRDEVVDELSARAARSGRSLQEYLRARLTGLSQTVDADAVSTWAQGLLAGEVSAPRIVPVEVSHVLRRTEREGDVSSAVTGLAHRDLLTMTVETFLSPRSLRSARAGAAPHGDGA